MKEFITSRWATISNFLDTQELPTTDIKDVFSWSYWTQGPLTPDSPYYLAVTAVFLLIIIALTVWRQRLKRLHQAVPIYELPLNHLVNIVIFIATLSFGYLFFRTQQLAYLSSRLYLLAVLVIAGLWIVYVTIYLLRIIPTKRRLYLEQERFFRYLPNTAMKGKNK